MEAPVPQSLQTLALVMPSHVRLLQAQEQQQLTLLKEHQDDLAWAARWFALHTASPQTAAAGIGSNVRQQLWYTEHVRHMEGLAQDVIRFNLPALAAAQRHADTLALARSAPIAQRAFDQMAGSLGALPRSHAQDASQAAGQGHERHKQHTAPLSAGAEPSCAAAQQTQTQRMHAALAMIARIQTCQAERRAEFAVEAKRVVDRLDAERSWLQHNAAQAASHDHHGAFAPGRISPLGSDWQRELSLASQPVKDNGLRNDEVWPEARLQIPPGILVTAVGLIGCFVPMYWSCFMGVAELNAEANVVLQFGAFCFMGLVAYKGMRNLEHEV